jgi:hypothetical protein
MAAGLLPHGWMTTLRAKASLPTVSEQALLVMASSSHAARHSVLFTVAAERMASVALSYAQTLVESGCSCNCVPVAQRIAPCRRQGMQTTGHALAEGPGDWWKKPSHGRGLARCRMRVATRWRS